MKYKYQLPKHSAMLLLLAGLQFPMIFAQKLPDEPGLWVTGRNAEGQLGNNMTGEDITSLTHISGVIGEDISAITAGEHQSYFLTINGKLWASGTNDYGQLGDGTTEMRSTPVQVINGTEVSQIFAGRHHGFFIRADGSLWAMGRNDYGQLGDGTIINRSEPVQVAGQVVWAAGGEFHSLFIKSDKSLWAVGRNNVGQLGDGTNNDQSLHVKIAEGVLRVYAGWQNSYFIKEDGVLLATGDNAYGMLGIGQAPDAVAFVHTPTSVLGATSVDFVSVKSEHMYFVQSNRQLWSVGRNQYGQLGNGLHNDSYTPLQVRNGTNVVAVAAGDGYGVFLRSDSTLWAMGNPVHGRMAFDGSDEQQLPLWAFNRYKGDVHNHSSYSWSHGSHRSGGSNWDPIQPGWNPPPGMGPGGGQGEYPPVLNPKGIADPNYYTSHSGPQAYQMDRAKNRGPKYQFYVASDHCHEGPFHPVDPENNEYWKDIRESARNTVKDPDFTGMSGMEYSRNSDPEGTGSGHQVYINTHDYVSAMNVDAIGIPQLYTWLKSARPLDDKGYVVLNFAHPGRTQYNDWAHWDSQIVDIATLCEITSVYRNRYLSGWHRSLNKGWKTSPTGVQDSHGYWNLENRPPLTNILATELSTESVTRAMRQRRTYVAWTGEKEDNVDNDLRYSVNGYIMGSTLNSPTTFNFQIEIQTPKGRTNHYVRRIQIIRNHPTNLDGTQIAAEMVFPGTESKVVWNPTIEDSDAKWFYLLVHHWVDTNNDPVNTTYASLGSTYSAPTWTGRGSNHGDGSLAIHHAVESLSTPIRISSGIKEVVTGGSHTMVLSYGNQVVSTFTPQSTPHPASMKVFPNPAKDLLEIEVSRYGNENLNFKLLDIHGKIIKSWSSAHHISNMDTSALAQGLYVLMVNNNNSMPLLYKKIIITR